MFSRMSMKSSTESFSQWIERLRTALDDAEVVIIGAGAGLSVSAGFMYTGERFQRYFSDFSAEYDIQDMYSGSFYPFPSQEESWAYWSRYIWINRYQDPPKPVYQRLLDLIRDKDYFVLTTNVDHCFQKAGFDKARLFYTQGDYGLFQCGEPCCQETFDNKSVIRSMVEQQSDRRVPSSLLPRCPRCGKPMIVNLRSDGRFVEDAGWHAAARRYGDFLRRCQRKRTLFLELGVGYNTPGIIKYSFWWMTAENPKAVYACVNEGQAACPPEIRKRSICVSQDIGQVLQNL